MNLIVENDNVFSIADNFEDPDSIIKCTGNIIGSISKFDIRNNMLGKNYVVALKCQFLDEFDKNLVENIDKVFKVEALTKNNALIIKFPKSQMYRMLEDESFQIKYSHYSPCINGKYMKPIHAFGFVSIAALDVENCFMSLRDFYSVIRIMFKKYPKYETLVNAVKTYMNRAYGKNVFD